MKIRRLIPRVRSGGWSSCERFRQFEGRFVAFYWLDFVLEISAGARDRSWDAQ